MIKKIIDFFKNFCYNIYRKLEKMNRAKKLAKKALEWKKTDFVRSVIIDKVNKDKAKEKENYDKSTEISINEGKIK